MLFCLTNRFKGAILLFRQYSRNTIKKEGPMKNLQVMAMIAGLCFGVWPLMMNQGKLNGNLASFVFAVIAAVCIFPFAFSQLGGLAQARWWIVISAGIIGAVGLLAFVGMLSKASPDKVSSLFVTMIIVQTAVPVAYQLFVAGGMTTTKGVGFVLAIIAAVLLSL